MDKKEFIKETVDELLELKNNWKKQGALEEIEKLKKSLGYNNEYWQYLEDRKKEILRGWDDLNSNKTPKEFCKDKERNWAYALNGDDGNDWNNNSNSIIWKYKWYNYDNIIIIFNLYYDKEELNKYFTRARRFKLEQNSKRVLQG